LHKAKEATEEGFFPEDKIKLVGVGKLLKSKGFDRILKIVKRLKDQQLPVHFYLLGAGEEEGALRQYAEQNGLQENVEFLGYQVNPYKYIAGCDLFLCASFREGFSTAATEALILGVPVCTVEVSGMKEMLGYDNEYGIVVENDDEALYLAVKELVMNPDRLRFYKECAIERGSFFTKERTVKCVENIFDGVHE
jgi:glycosyltransferase involved in cell wall biosynthesis